MSTLYERDFCAWSFEQAQHLKKREFSMLDFEHLIDEVETLSGSDQQALRSHMSNVIAHLLKQRYQPTFWTKSWDDSIDAAREEIRYLIKKNPSFKRFLPEFLPIAYKTGRVKAYKETGLETETFPKECIFSINEVLDE